MTLATLGFTAAASAATAAPAARTAHITSKPSGGPPVYTPPCSNAVIVADAGGCAGYVASGRNFRYAQAVITVPTVPCSPPLHIYIGLTSGDAYAQAGIRCLADVIPAAGVRNAPPAQWEAYATTWHNGSSPVTRTISLSTVAGGQGVFFSIYYNQQGNELHFDVTVPTVPSPTSHLFSFNAHGAVYSRAVALADWSESGLTQDSLVTVPGPVPFQDFRLTQFLQGRFTTGNGDRGTFAGPWTLNPVEVTYPDGQPPPYNKVTADPSYLFNDGNSLNGMWGDAFGIWRRHNA